MHRRRTPPGRARDFNFRESLGGDSTESLSGPVEGEYLKSLVAQQTPIEIHLRNGETHRGVVEYYDQRFVRLTPKGSPNLFIFKQDIKYIVEQ